MTYCNNSNAIIINFSKWKGQKDEGQKKIKIDYINQWTSNYALNHDWNDYGFKIE